MKHRASFRLFLGTVALLSLAAPASSVAAAGVAERSEQRPVVTENSFMHRNFYRQITLVEDRTKPLYKMELRPVMGPGYKSVTKQVQSGWERVPVMGPRFEDKMVTWVSGYRTVKVEVGSEPIYGTRVVGERRVAVYRTETVCVERFRGRCLQYGTNRVFSHWDVQLVYGRVVVGYRTIFADRQVPIISSRMEKVQVCAKCEIVRYDRAPIFETKTVLEKYCDACIVERMVDQRVLVGFQTTETLTGPSRILYSCDGRMECGAKRDTPYGGTMYRYVGHDTIVIPGGGGRGIQGCPEGQVQALNGACVWPPLVCPDGYIKTLDGKSCVQVESPCKAPYYLNTDGKCVRVDDNDDEYEEGVCDDTTLATDLKCRGNGGEKPEDERDEKSEIEDEKSEIEDEKETPPPAPRPTIVVRPS